MLHYAFISGQGLKFNHAFLQHGEAKDTVCREIVTRIGLKAMKIAVYFRATITYDIPKAAWEKTPMFT